MRPRVALALALPLLAACARQPEPTVVAANGDYRVQVWPLPAAAGAASPDLSLAPGGRLLLSWMSRQPGRRNALQFASWSRDGGWQSQPRTIAVGQSLVANWADVPHLRATPDGALWVQWLQADPGNPSGYHAVLARSRDGGMRWEQMTRINDDAGPGEHGFAALWPIGGDRLGVAWLDGRAQGMAGHDHAGVHAGAMQLRTNAFDMDLGRGSDAVVDAATCDCCQTDVAMTDRGPLLVYRDRGQEEVRDIASVRFEVGRWTSPTAVHADGWQVSACPVNGPAVAARGNAAVVAWYSEAGGTPAVRLARSTDAGDRYAAPVVVDQGAAVTGQVDVALDGDQAWVAWLREDATGQTLMLARYAPDLSRQLQRIEVARPAGRGHATGSPRLVADGGSAWLVWTDVADGVAHLQGAQLVR